MRTEQSGPENTVLATKSEASPRWHVLRILLGVTYLLGALAHVALGVFADESVTNRATIDRYDEYPLETLDVPTLVVHAEDDPLASFEDARRMVQRFPDVAFLRYETGGHLVFGHGDEIRRTVSAFVDRNT